MLTTHAVLIPAALAPKTMRSTIMPAKLNVTPNELRQAMKRGTLEAVVDRTESEE